MIGAEAEEDDIRILFEKHGHVMRTAELRAAKIYYEDIQKLLADGVIERIKQGYYHLVDEYSNNEADIYYVP